MPSRVPSGYEASRVAGAVVTSLPRVREFVEAAIREHGSLFAFAARHSVAAMIGRSTAHLVETPGGSVVVRHYTRGGAMTPLGDRYLGLGARRPDRELRISVRARSRGVRTPEVAATAVYGAGVFYRADIATAFIPHATTLADATFGPGRRPEGDRIQAWFAAGRLVRSAAAAGLIHADLNLRNVLVAWPDGLPAPYLLDLDRCRVVRGTSVRHIASMTRRLRRSAVRFERQTGQSLEREMAAFAEGIHG